MFQMSNPSSDRHPGQVKDFVDELPGCAIFKSRMYFGAAQRKMVYRILSLRLFPSEYQRKLSTLAAGTLGQSIQDFKC